MSWAKFAIEKLQAGETTQIRPKGHSMTGKVNHLDLVTLEPCEIDNLEIGSIVLVRVKGNVYLHLVKAIKQVGDQKRFLIGNNRGGTNGWVNGKAIYGIATQIGVTEDNQE
jgi:hypothetical protein